MKKLVFMMLIVVSAMLAPLHIAADTNDSSPSKAKNDTIVPQNVLHQESSRQDQETQKDGTEKAERGKPRT